jgi:hypothetical protein
MPESVAATTNSVKLATVAMPIVASSLPASVEGSASPGSAPGG